MKKVSKKSRLMIIVVAVLLMAVAIYFYFRSKPDKDEDETEPVLDIEDPVSPTVSKPLPKPSGKGWDNSLNYNKALKKGDRGSMVQWTQQAINRSRKLHKMPPISEDGVFGAQTEKSVENMTGKKAATYNQVKKSVVANFTKKGLPNPYSQLVVDVVAPIQTQTTWSMGAPTTTFPIWKQTT